MPYLLSNEPLFIVLMGLLIVGLLTLRWTIVRRRNRLAKGDEPPQEH